MKKNEESAAFFLQQNNPSLNLSPLNAREDNNIGYCTVHAFKGMESQVVILTDIENIKGRQSESLLYIGMSRAKIRLCILMSEKCRDDWFKLLL